MKLFRTKWFPHIGFMLILLLFSIVYYSEMITRLPFGIHEWAQGDRLALAINFYDNGLNFFKPATHSLYSIQGIVGVEFPIQSYIAGALGYIFGRDAINTCFRVEDILIGWMGLYFLFRIVYDRTVDFVLSIVAPVIVFCSPVFIFYISNYLPDPASVSVVFAAFYFFLQYADTGRFSKLVVAIAVVTIAVLMKASTVSYWAGIVCYGLYTELITRKSRRKTLLLLGVAIASCGIIFCEIGYIQYLNTTYSSTLFLARTNPFTSWDDFETYINFPFKDTWMPEYFLLAEYPVIVFIIAIGIHVLLKASALKRYLLPVPMFLAGAIVMFYLFGNQLPVHDYYVLAIFFPLIAYLLVVSVIGFYQRFRLTALREMKIGLFATVVLLFFLADHQIYNRFHQNGHYNDNYSSYWLMDAAPLIDSVKIPKAEHIVVAGEHPPNLSLVYFNRKGYVISPEAWDDNIGSATRLLKERHLRYLIIREASFRNALAKDSTGVAAYDLVTLTKGTAILRLKP